MSPSEHECKTHFYYCALMALKLAAKYEAVHSPLAKMLFLTRWLNNARKKRVFSPVVENDIIWLRKTVIAGGPLINIEHFLQHIYQQARVLNIC